MNEAEQAAEKSITGVHKQLFGCLFFLNKVDIIRTRRCPLEMDVEREKGIEIYENIDRLINLRSKNLCTEQKRDFDRLNMNQHSSDHIPFQKTHIKQ